MAAVALITVLQLIIMCQNARSNAQIQTRLGNLESARAVPPGNAPDISPVVAHLAIAMGEMAENVQRNHNGLRAQLTDLLDDRLLDLQEQVGHRLDALEGRLDQVSQRLGLAVHRLERRGALLDKSLVDREKAG